MKFKFQITLRSLCFVFDNAGTCSRILETKHTTEEVKNATAGNNEMYGELNDQSTILKDEKITMIKFPK